ncbi:hypothetical protein VNI00_003783 [Paramarasmius palmivorus]|uniref:Uncharacterized protein n=1 Tax=Paramarasmius palmivorus TaxID=297713 RepID=A0AAW0DN56_9AGAR
MKWINHLIIFFLLVLCLADTGLAAPAKKKPKVPSKRPSTPPPPVQRPPTPPAGSSGSSSGPDPAEKGKCAQPAELTLYSKVTSVKGSNGKNVCGFKKDGSGCVGLSSLSSNLLAKDVTECRSLATQNQATADKDKALNAAVDSEFNRIEAHIFGTDPTLGKTVGRHLASNFVPKNKELIRQSNTKTFLSRFLNNPNDNINNPVKTTWDDDDTEGAGWTKAEVETMCKFAIKTVLKSTGKEKLKSGGSRTSMSVPSGRNFNLCLTVLGDASVFPKSIDPTTAKPGTPC